MQATLIKAPAGLGKTLHFAREVAKFVGIVEIYAPTHALAEHWESQILVFNPSKKVQVIRGRNFPIQSFIGSSKTPHNGHLCNRVSAADALTNAGLPVYPNLCKRSQGPGAAPAKCSFYDHCDYIHQFQAADIYIYTHAHLSQARSALESWQPSLVIIDESCFQSLIEELIIPISLLTHPNVPAIAQSLCTDLANAFRAGGGIAQRIVAASATSELDDAVMALKLAPAISPSSSDRQQKSVLKTFVSFERIRRMLVQLKAETQVRASPQSVVYDATTGDIKFQRRKPVTRFDLGRGTQPDVYLLDASASELIAGKFFEIKQFVDMQVPRQAYVVQCHSTRCPTTSLVPARNSNPSSAADAARRLAEIEGLIKKNAIDGQKVLVVGPSAVVGNAAKGELSLVTVPSHCELAHFNSLRGIDRWKDFDAVVIIGRNEPPVSAVEDMARALYFDETTPLDLRGAWEVRVRGYRMKGSGPAIGIETMVHPDLRVQEVLEQLRESETLQAVDRLRLLHNPTKRPVILLSNLPLDIDVDETRTWDELMHGTRLERAWDVCSGVLPLDPAWLSSNHPTLWSTAGAAKQDVRKARKKGGFSKMFSIRKKTLFAFDYKRPSQRQWSRCLADNASQRRVAKALEALTGGPVKAKLKGRL